MFPRHSSQHRTKFRKETQKRYSHAIRPNTKPVSETMFPRRSSQHRTGFRNGFHADRPNTEPVSEIRSSKHRTVFRNAETMFPRRSSQHRTGFRNNVPTPLKRCSRSSKHRLPPAMSRVHPFRTAALPPEVHEWRRQIVVIGRLISGENPVLLPCRFSGGQSNDAFISRTLYPDCTPCTRATMLPRNEAELEL